MSYEDYTVNDFITDMYFQKWVTSSDALTDRFWQTWIIQHPGKADTIREARLMVDLLTFREISMGEEEARAVAESTKSQIKFGEADHCAVNTLPVQEGIWQPSGAWRRYKAAAVVGLALLSTLLFLLRQQENNKVYTTRYGEIQRIQLPDSSLVTINAHSTLEVSANWQENREVWLNGEAFFEVKKVRCLESQPAMNAPFRKFTVHTRHLDIEVLGTSFNVNERRGTTKVVLNKGVVELKKKAADSTILRMEPGDLVKYSEKETAFERKMVNPQVASSWKDGMLVFEATPISEIAQLIEDNYGYQVSFQDPGIANRKFNASIPSGNISLLLELIAESLDVEVIRKHKEIIFK